MLPIHFPCVRDFQVWRDRSGDLLPDKGFHYSICLLECYLKINGRKYTLFTEDEPNSIHCNRNILQAVADENDKGTLTTLLVPIEQELQYLRKTTMVIHSNGKSYSFHLNFEATMFDEKLDRARLGMEGTGSNSICTLCNATRIAARTQVGEHSITKTIDDLINSATHVTDNPTNLAGEALYVAKAGMKSQPLMSDIGIGFESLHADLSWARFVIHLVVHLKANVHSWAKNSENKEELLKEVQRFFDDFIRKETGKNINDSSN